jgi:SPX domain protein involved in polyphosphate accumulation
MKFGKKLQDAVEAANKDWKPYFIDYKGLKRLIAMSVVEYKDKEFSGVVEEEKEEDKKEEQTAEKGENIQREETENTALGKRKLKNFSGEEFVDYNNKRRMTFRSCLISFFVALRHELDKVNDFYLDKEEELIISHHILKVAVADYVSRGPFFMVANRLVFCKVSSPKVTRDDWRNLKRQLIDLHGNAVMLESYATVNYTGFRKILKKLDKKTGFSFRKKYLEVVWRTPFFSLGVLQNIVKETEKCLQQLEQIAPKCI